MRITNSFNLPDPVYRTVCWAVERYEGPKAAEITHTRRISAATLINPPRLTMLRAQHDADLEVDASNLLFLVQGIAFHFMMGRVGFGTESIGGAPARPYVEAQIERSHRGWTITGQFDVLDGTTISDWKWTAIWSLTVPRSEWEAQLNVYRWLAASKGLEVDSLQTWALLRDWSPAKAAGNRRLPPVPFARLDQPAWSVVELEEYIDARISVYEEAVRVVEQTGDPNQVPVCGAEERWNREGESVRCTTYCDMARYCSFGALQRGPDA